MNEKPAPMIVQAGLFPFMMVAALTSTWYMLDAGVPEPVAIGSVMFTVFFVVTVAQFLWPYHSEWNSNSNGDLQVDIGYFITNSIVLRFFEFFILSAAVMVAVWLGDNYGAGDRLWPTHWHWSLQLILAMVLGELVEYWWHRAMHEIPWLWRFHAVHHSAPRLYWLNALRFHPIDFVIGSLGRLIPAAMLGAGPHIMTLGAVLSGVHGVFQHCNIQVRIGPLNWIFSMAELHRWHHSRTIEESNTNYGGNFIIWDVVFGTRFLPKDREPPRDIGISQMPNFPTGLTAQLMTPFRWQKVVEESKADS
jgi:sterol desaturase/sphingolipid hydroxylase (fatty acid hydroxylase superfamily)